MESDQNKSSYNVFRETIDEYGDDKGHDLLTDPNAIAEVTTAAAQDRSMTHGLRLKQIRQSKGFTVEELAERSGLDAESLERMEAGEYLLPLGQLIKLSKALSLKMSDVIATGTESFTIVRADERQSVKRLGASKEAKRGYEYESLAPGKKDRAIEPFIVTLHPSDDDEKSSHDGQEFIFILEGEMEAFVDDHRAVLKPGDAIYYDSTSVHLVRAYGDKPARILAIIIS
ncbi:MAG: XRE family transcriptional regulator [Syntrophaceae bacterium]|nr:XRE family transcriptional regulator [Syntrophaceae bacterium]